MQVYERAMEVHGSEEEMEKARLKKVERREKQQQKKFDKNVKGNIFIQKQLFSYFFHLIKISLTEDWQFT